MPAQSEQQRKWAFAVKGPAWAKKHHFNNKGHLPDHLSRKHEHLDPAKKKRKKKSSTMPDKHGYY